jgi:putative transposase
VIVFVDEVGFLMSPCRKPTWAPRGQTPVVPHRNRHHQKVSAIGAIAWAAEGDPRVFIDWHPGAYVRGAEAAEFLARLLAEVPGPVELVWDNLQAHKAPAVKQLARAHPRLSLHYLPAYAPDLNPVEALWCLTKHHRMANHALESLEALEAEARRHVATVAAEPALLRACFRTAKLALYSASAQ